MSPFSAGVRGLRFANADVLGASVKRKLEVRDLASTCSLVVL